MNLDQLIVDLIDAQRQAGRMAPVGLRRAKPLETDRGQVQVTTVRPVIVRIEAGNVYLDPEPL